MTGTSLRIRAGAVQVAHYLPSMTYGPRRLPNYEFVWLLSGSARWRVDELDPTGNVVRQREYELEPGVLVLARAGTVDSYVWDDRHTSSHAFVHFDIESLEPLGAAANWPVIRPMEGNNPLAGLCSYLLSLASTGGHQARQRSDEIVTMLLDIFVRGPLPPTSRSLLPARLVAAVDYVSAKWESDGIRIVSVAELANAAQLSVGHLSRMFRQEFDCGPASGLELVRLGHAAITLQRSNLTLFEVARLSGFSNPYHFSRRFSAAYDSSPGRFRKHEHSDALWPLKRAGLLPLWGALLGRENTAEWMPSTQGPAGVRATAEAVTIP